MAIAKRLKRAAVAVLTVLGLLLWLVALLLFTRVTENSDDFASRQDVILLINSVGIGVLLILIVSNLWQLVRDYRRLLEQPGPTPLPLLVLGRSDSQESHQLRWCWPAPPAMRHTCR